MDPVAAVIAGVAFFGLWRLRWNVLWVVLGSALVGLLYQSVA